MSKSRRLIEAAFGAPAPAPVAPPKPTTRPSERPGQAPPNPNPWRRKEIRPGEEPAPKACRESRARKVIEALGVMGYPNPYHQEPEREGLTRALEIVHKKFVDERIHGYPAPDGRFVPPVSPEEAEQKWQRIMPRFLAMLRERDPETEGRLKIKHLPPDEPREPAAYDV